MLAPGFERAQKGWRVLIHTLLQQGVEQWRKD